MLKHRNGQIHEGVRTHWRSLLSLNGHVAISRSGSFTARRYQAVRRSGTQPLIWSGRGNPCRIVNRCRLIRIRTQIKQSTGNWRRASRLRALLHCGCYNHLVLWRWPATWDVTGVANTVTSYVIYPYDHWYVRCRNFITVLVQCIRYTSLFLALFMRLI